MSATWDSNEVAKGIADQLKTYVPDIVTAYNELSTTDCALIPPRAYKHRQGSISQDVTSPFIEVTVGDSSYTPLGGGCARSMVDARFEISYKWTHSKEPDNWPDYSRTYAGIIARALNEYIEDCRQDHSPPFHESAVRGARVEREVATEANAGESAVVLLVMGTTGPMEEV